MSLKTAVGGAESDSFVTVAQADSYLDSMPDDTTEWDALSTEEKELRLQLAVQLMGYLQLRGKTVFRNQNLCFPRTCQPYSGRFSIPVEVKKSQSYLAYSIVHRGLSAMPGMGEGLPSTVGSPSSISIGGLVSVSFRGQDSAGGTLLERLVASLPFPVMMWMKRFVAQIRGGTVLDAEDERTLSTTSTTISSGVTTTTV